MEIPVQHWVVIQSGNMTFYFLTIFNFYSFLIKTYKKGQKSLIKPQSTCPM